MSSQLGAQQEEDSSLLSLIIEWRYQWEFPSWSDHNYTMESQHWSMESSKLLVPPGLLVQKRQVLHGNLLILEEKPQWAVLDHRRPAGSRFPVSTTSLFPYVLDIWGWDEVSPPGHSFQSYYHMWWTCLTIIPYGYSGKWRGEITKHSYTFVPQVRHSLYV